MADGFYCFNGYLAKVDGDLMLFASEQDYYDYMEDNEDV